MLQELKVMKGVVIVIVLSFTLWLSIERKGKELY